MYDHSAIDYGRGRSGLGDCNLHRYHGVVLDLREDIIIICCQRCSVDPNGEGILLVAIFWGKHFLDSQSQMVSNLSIL